MQKVVTGIDQLPFVGFQDIEAFAQVGLVVAELKFWAGVGGTGLIEMGALRGTELNELGRLWGIELQVHG